MYIKNKKFFFFLIMSVKFSGSLRLRLGFPIDYLCCLGEGASISSLSIITSKNTNTNSAFLSSNSVPTVFLESHIHYITSDL